MHPARRHLLAWPLAALLPATASAARREVDDLGLSLELPDAWVPIPRAEILEARERAIAAGASTEWTVRAAWQPPPHLRWFTLPHLTLESRPAPGLPDTEPTIERAAGRSGPRTVQAHRADWRREGLDLRLSLLAFEPWPEFDAWVASLRSTRSVAR